MHKTIQTHVTGASVEQGDFNKNRLFVKLKTTDGEFNTEFHSLKEFAMLVGKTVTLKFKTQKGYRYVTAIQS